MNGKRAGFVMAAALCAGAAWAADSAPSWSWAFPGFGPPPTVDATTPHSLAGSAAHYTAAQGGRGLRPVDWYPAEHPPLPAAVTTALGGEGACAACHLPTGAGRPENAAIAGLPADYIEHQMTAFASGARHSVGQGAVHGMVGVAKAITPAVSHQAALYFSALPFAAHTRVIETDRAPPVTAQGFIYAFGAGAPTPLGDRILEGTDTPERFELRDPHLVYTAYVPIGAIEEGRALAATGGPAQQPCEGCHGSGLTGEIGPPLAGRSPTGMVRQLLSFRADARSGPDAAPMQAVVQGMTDHEMIALAAYAATLKP